MLQSFRVPARYCLVAIVLPLVGNPVFAQPSNDDCANAVFITLGSSITGTTVDAHPSGSPQCVVSNGSKDVWYTFTGVSGIVKANTCAAASFDTKLSVYSGACGNLQCVFGNDDACSDRSEVVLSAQPGTVYYILVHAYNINQAGTFTLSLQATGITTVAPNDGCASAIEIECGSNVAGSTVNATPENVAFCGVAPEANGVWYTFTGVGGAMVLSTCAVHSYDTQLNLYSGSCGALTCVGGNDDGPSCSGGSRLTFTANPALQYFVYVQGYSGDAGTFQLSLTKSGGGSCHSRVRAFLEGAYDPVTGLMRDSLRVHSDFPLSEPYTALGYHHVGGGGGETIDPNVLTLGGSNAVVDWVVVEIRDAHDPGRRLLSRSALIQRDGDIVGLDGVTDVALGPLSGRYHMAVRHRNHLGVITAKTIDPLTEVLDLTLLDSNLTYGVDSRRTIGAHMVLWSGDVSFDGQVKYTGMNNDRDPILIAVGSTLPTNVVSGYRQEDVNLNANTKYTGPGNDRDPILVTVGGTTPNNVRHDYLPDSLRLRQNVIVVDSNAWVLDTVLSDPWDTGLIVYTTTEAAPDVQVNDVLIGSTGPGYLRRATSVTFSSGTLTIQTSPASLSDVFESGRLAFETEVSHSPHSVTETYNATLLDDANPHVTVKLEETSLTFDPHFESSVDFDEGGVNSFYFAAKNAALSGTGKLTVAVEGTWSGDAEVEIAEFRMPIRFVVAIGPVPVPIVIDIKAELAAKLEGSLAATYTNSFTGTVSSQATLGVKYESGAFTFLRDLNAPTPTCVLDGVNLSGSVSLTAGCELKLSALLYNMIGPYVSVGPEFELGASGTVQGDWSVEAGLSVASKVGLVAQVVDTLNLFDVNYEKKWELAEYSTPDTIEVKPGSDTEFAGFANSTTSEPVRVLVTDSEGEPQSNVQVRFTPVVGSGEVSHPIAMTNDDGIAETEWTLPLLGEPYTLHATVKDGEGSNVHGSPLVFHAHHVHLSSEIAQGDDQVGDPGEPLPAALGIRVSDQFGDTWGNIPVQFSVVSGGGSLSGTLETTDVNGMAFTAWSIGTDPSQPQIVQAEALDPVTGEVASGGPHVFSAVVAQLTLGYGVPSGNGQSGFENQQLPIPLTVVVNSTAGHPQEGAVVHFDVSEGGGSLNASSVITNSAGKASVWWTLGPSGPQSVSAVVYDDNGLIVSGGPLVFTGAIFTCPPVLNDVQGNTYNVVRIGMRCWTKENLSTSAYDNGDPILNGSGLTSPAWAALQSGAYAIPHQDYLPSSMTSEEQAALNAELATLPAGKNYNHYAVVDPRGLCPSGWHVATDADWLAMEGLLGMPTQQLLCNCTRGYDENVGGRLKGAGLWTEVNDITDEIGFSALPAGNSDPGGRGVGENAWFWTSDTPQPTMAYVRVLSLPSNYSVANSPFSAVGRQLEHRVDGYSCRCVKNP